MITKELIERGIKENLILFISDPVTGNGTVCRIGDFRFYFGGMATEEMNPREYLKAVPMDDIVSDIYYVLEAFRNYSESDEYDYCETILTGRKHPKLKKWNVQITVTQHSNIEVEAETAEEAEEKVQDIWENEGIDMDFIDTVDFWAEERA